MKIQRSMLVVLLGLFVASSATATIIVETVGKQWPGAGQGGPYTLGVTGAYTWGVANDGEDHFWMSPASQMDYTYTLDTADLTDPLGWRASMGMKVESIGSNWAFDNSLEVYDGARRYSLLVQDDVVKLYIQGGGPYSTIWTGDVNVYRDYAIEFDPSDVGDEISILIDGDVVATRNKNWFYATTAKQFKWGDYGGSNGVHENRYSYTRFETIPEPATMGLLIGGGLLCGLVRKMRI